jgi:acetolactate synthase-1/2/3 large subunit
VYLLMSYMQPQDGRVRETWLKECRRVWHQLPREEQYTALISKSSQVVHSSSVMECLNEVAPANAVFVTDVGAGLLSGHYSLRPMPGWRVMTSQGLGEMGFGLPAAIGAHIADPTRPIICLNTDGGLMFNIQELETARNLQIPLKLFVFNNDGYGMIRISQQNLFDGRFAGIDPKSGVSFPNFKNIAASFGLTHVLIDSENTMKSSLTQVFKAPEATLIEVVMSPDQKYEPRLKTQKLPDGSLSSPPLDDLEPFLPLDVLEDLLGCKAHRNSYLSRGLIYD